MPVRASRSTTVLRPGRAFGLCALVAALAAGPSAGVATATRELGPRQPVESCPNSQQPPPAVDTSEVPPPGEPSPEPLPVPERPVGGEQLGSCGIVMPPVDSPPPEQVEAETWLLADLDNGQVLAAKNPHSRQRPASVIKVLTALVTIRELDLDATIVANQADADQEGSKVGLSPGVTYTVRQVLTGLIMQSGNDAAHALARKVGGNEAMVAKMNEQAKRLGAQDTRTATPSGLDGPGMSTSAYDMALIFRAAMREPAFVEAARTKQATLPGEQPLEIVSDNRVLLDYPGAIGGKTGFTDDARHTFIAGAERDGRRLVAVLLRGENQPIRLSEQTEQLLDYGFELPRDASVGELVSPTKPTPPASSAAPDERAATTGQSGTGSPLFGTVGAPLTAAAAAGLVLAALVTLRKRRARVAAAARRNSAKLPDDHP